jgi:nicotinamide riboside transporter PnuC
MNIIQLIASITGIVGTFILSSKWAAQSRWRFWAFALYLISNTTMIVVGLDKAVWSVVLMQVVYLAFTINGLRNNRP